MSYGAEFATLPEQEPPKSKDAIIASLRNTVWVYRVLFVVLLILCGVSYYHVQDANRALVDSNTPEREWKRLEADAQTFIDRPDPRMPGHGYAMRGYTRIRMRDFDAGKKDLVHCREVDPKYTMRSHYTFSVFALAEYGFGADADELFRTGREDVPDDYSFAMSYAAFLSSTKNDSFRDTARAVELMELATSLKKAQKNEDLSRYELWNYGEMLANDGRADAAITTLEKVLAIPLTSEHDPTEKFVEKVTKTLAKLKDGSYKPKISFTY